MKDWGCLAAVVLVCIFLVAVMAVVFVYVGK